MTGWYKIPNLVDPMMELFEVSFEVRIIYITLKFCPAANLSYYPIKN